jgi:molybdopterin/thiamine biosynthesis adenylyltransferase
MDVDPMKRSWTLTLTASFMDRLQQHLFPGDGDEHGAVISAGLAETSAGVRLLARDLYLATDGVDYIPGQRGYRMLTGEFVRESVLNCADENLAYLAVHCHGGTDQVGFSGDDLASHERGYPALLDILDGRPAGALVFAPNAIAGDIWLPDRSRVQLESARVVGRPLRNLYPEPPAQPALADPAYDRQARIFGDRGQAILARQKVAVIGAGGAGSLLVEYLARLGVGTLLIIDPDRIELTNLPRVVGSSRWDAHAWLTDPSRPEFLRQLGRRFAAHKVGIAKRVARQARRETIVEPIIGNVVDHAVATRLLDCDYLFLAADSMQARLVFNSIVHQYLIPGVQVGAKVQVDKATGDIVDAFSVCRPVTPDQGCLWCNELINPAKLAEEAEGDEVQRQQRYLDDSTVGAPSVITLNAVSASRAADDYLFSVTGLLESTANSWVRFLPRTGDIEFIDPRSDAGCSECGHAKASRLARGDASWLPTRR